MNLKLIIYIFIIFSCVTKAEEQEHILSDNIISGAEQTHRYTSIIQDKKVALVVNQTSLIHQTHLVDSLLKKGIDIQCIFAPEHGFRGTADAGEKIENGLDIETQLPIYSLYGKNKKPSIDQLDNIEVVLFDIQDVGVRFYTYISTLHYVMEACAENNIPLIVLDRPNPNAHYIDGNILDLQYKSFVGMHPVPIVYGMTIGEYAMMINGEGWLENQIKCDLTVIENKRYNHSKFYDLPIPPSPNLPNNLSIQLYPSLCFFEGTDISVGRGTNLQFQQIGHPKLNQFDDYFTPVSSIGAKYPKHENKVCFGMNFEKLSNEGRYVAKGLDLNYLIQMWKECKKSNIEFFTNSEFFDLLAGGKTLREDIIAGLDAESIKSKWESELEQFKKVRTKYLIYPN